MKKSWPVLIAGLSFLLMTGAALAEGVVGGISDTERLVGIAAAAGAEDSGIIRITPDRTKLVRLRQDAASVIVTNPAHASVLLDSPRLLVVMPRLPGTTSFTVLNARGDVIMERTVIVASTAQPKYVRVRRICGSGDSGCVPSAYFYCPDGCYEVMTVPPGETQVPEIPASRVSAGAMGGDETGLQGMGNPIGIGVTPGSDLAPTIAPEAVSP
jgi:hypothetical protein